MFFDRVKHGLGLAFLDDMNNADARRECGGSATCLMFEAYSCAVRMLNSVNAMLLDNDFKILFWPSSLDKLYGYEKVDANDQNYFSLLKVDIEVANEICKSFSSCSYEWSGELTYRSKDDNEIRVYSHWKQYVSGESGEHYYIIDDVVISKIKDAEKAKDLALNMMKHDLKSPLSGIVGLSELMLAEDPCQNIELTNQYLVLIHEASKKALAKIERYFVYLKLESCNYEPNRERIDVLKVLNKVVDSFSTLALQKKVKVNISRKINEEQCAGFSANINTILFEMITENLIKNAIEASPPDCIVDVNLIVSKSSIEFSVHNNGCVPESIRTKFFEKYTTFGKAFGVGLGTYIARLATEVQNGKIYLEIVDENNTLVKVVLPA